MNAPPVVLAVFAKPPLPGRCKSRLAKVWGAEAAAALASAMLGELVAQSALALTLTPELWHPPDATPADFGALLPPTWACHAQHGADLGERLDHAVATVLGRQPGARVLLVGADAAAPSATTWLRAAATLDQVPSVWQPAHDGGYLLAGFARHLPAVFRAIPWGGPEVMAASRRQLLAIRRPWAELPTAHDVDEPGDLPAIHAAVATGRYPRLAAWLGRYP